MTGLRRKLAYGIAISGGAGLVPGWPGTAGAVVGIAVAAALLAANSGWVTLLGCALLFVVGVWAADSMCREYGIDDPQIVVVDETFGCAAVICVLPAEPLWWIAGFIAFRFFDIVKPWPIHVVEAKVRGGLGVMLDDAAAAVMAAASLLLAVQAIRYFS